MEEKQPIEIYSEIQNMVQKEIDDKIADYDNKSQFNLVDIPAHAHTGVDSQQVSYLDLADLPTSSDFLTSASTGKGTSLPSPASSFTDQYFYLTTTDTLYRSNGTAWIALN